MVPLAVNVLMSWRELQAADFLDDQGTMTRASHEVAVAAFPCTQERSSEEQEDPGQGGSTSSQMTPAARQVWCMLLQALGAPCPD